MSNRQASDPKAISGRELASVLAAGLFAALLGLAFAGYGYFQKTKQVETLETSLAAARPEHNQPTQALPVKASGVSFLEQALANAKARPGTHEALALLDDPHGFDALRANLLIAQGIPACERLDASPIRAFYGQLAEEIRRHADTLSRTPEGQAYLAEKGAPEFKMACANEVITRTRKIAYVDNDSIQPELPWHLFAHGIATEGRGTCVTMALLWKIVADRLGWPLFLRHAPTHLYLAWDDGAYRANLEATDSAKPVKDEEYRKREKVSEEDYKEGRYMRNLLPKEIVAAFVATRACHWRAVNAPMKEFEDLLLAAELDPRTPSYRMNLLKAWRGLRGLMDRDCEKLAGADAVAAARREQARQQGLERALAEAEAQKARLKAGSGIPDVKQLTHSPMYTGQGWEYNPKPTNRE